MRRPSTSGGPVGQHHPPVVSTTGCLGSRTASCRASGRRQTGPDVWAHAGGPCWCHPHAPVAPPRHRHGPGGFGLQRLPGKMIQSTFQDKHRAVRSGDHQQPLLCSPVPTRLSEPLAAPVRISGAPSVDLGAIVDQSDTDFGAALVDFGPPKTRVSRISEGVVNANPPVETCWGGSASVANGDALDRRRVLHRDCQALSTVDTWRVARGGSRWVEPVRLRGADAARAR